MIETLRQKQTLFLVILLTLAGMAGLGYLFASKKSEPVYLSKIDRIMYDTHNKSPKYIITLPDRVKKQETPEKEKNAPTQEAQAETASENPHSLEAVLSRIPNLGKLGDADGQKPLPDIQPRDNLVEEKNGLLLPKTDGKERPWETYGRKVQVMPRFNRVAVVIANLGANPTHARLINKGLPAEVSFSFSPYAPVLEKQLAEARTEGHETYMDFLLPSEDYLKSDSGPLSMSLTASLDENRSRLEKVIGAKVPSGGIIVRSGVADESNAEQLATLMQELKNRGLLVIDSVNHDGLAQLKIDRLVRAKADIVIENDYSRQSTEEKLQQAEQIARDKGRVIIVTEPKPVVVLALSEWIKSFSPQLSYEEMKEKNISEIAKPFALVPVSNLVAE